MLVMCMDCAASVYFLLLPAFCSELLKILLQTTDSRSAAFRPSVQSMTSTSDMHGGGELRFCLTTADGGGVAAPRAVPVAPAPVALAADSTREDIEFPSFSAGPLGDEAEWRKEGAGRLSSSAAFGKADSRTPSRGDQDAALASLHAMQVRDLQAAVRRKDELIERLEQQMSDMTRTLEAQFVSRETWAETEAQREATIQHLHAALTQASEEAQRFAQALDAEHADALQTKQQLKDTLERADANMRAARQEIEESNRQLQQHTAEASAARKQSQQYESQVQSLSRENDEITQKLHAAETDSRCLAREVQNLRQQLEAKEQELKAAERNASSQSQ